MTKKQQQNSNDSKTSMDTEVAVSESASADSAAPADAAASVEAVSEASDKTDSESKKEASVPAKKVVAKEEEVAFSDPTKKVAAVVAPVKVEGEDDSDILKQLLADPDQVVDNITQQVTKRVKDDLANRDNVVKVWNDFYKENQDLAIHKKLVDLVTAEVKAEDAANGNKLSWNEGAKIVAKRTRDLLTSIRSDSYEEVDTRAASEANAVSSSGNPTPSQVKKPSVKNFVNQVRELKQARGLS